MDESLAGRIFSKITIAIFVIALFDLFYINWWILQSQQEKEAVTNGVAPVATLPQATPLASPTPIDELLVDLIVETPSPSPVTTAVAQEKVTIQTAEKEIFIPIGSGYTTTQTYSDLSGVEVTIDSTKYPGLEGVYLEAAVWIEGGNGRAFGQLFNVNDKIGYIESQISNSTLTPTLKSSNKIPLASGAKTYRVQAKTDLANYQAHVDNARLKIVLK